MLRENVPGHDCRFALELAHRKDSIEIQVCDTFMIHRENFKPDFYISCSTNQLKG